MSEIDHEAAKVYAADCCQFYKECITDVGHKMSNQEQRELNLSRAYLDMVAQLTAERARVQALCEVIYDANGVAYPFGDMQKKMDTILEGRDAHAQGDAS